MCIGREGGGRTILAGLHGKLGPTGAAVPGENPFTGYLLASTMLFIKRGAIKIIINAIFFFMLAFNRRTEQHSLCVEAVDV